MSKLVLTPSQLKKPADAYTNRVYLGPKNLQELGNPQHLLIKGSVF
jgi:hypothetical protein